MDFIILFGCGLLTLVCSKLKSDIKCRFCASRSSFCHSYWPNQINVELGCTISASTSVFCCITPAKYQNIYKGINKFYLFPIHIISTEKWRPMLKIPCKYFYWPRWKVLFWETPVCHDIEFRNFGMSLLFAWLKIAGIEAQLLNSYNMCAKGDVCERFPIDWFTWLRRSWRDRLQPKPYALSVVLSLPCAADIFNKDILNWGVFPVDELFSDSIRMASL